MNTFVRVSLAVAVLLAEASAAQATTIHLDTCGIAGLCDQVTVTTMRVGNAIDVDVLGNPIAGLFGSSGANRAFGFNVLDPDAGVVISDMTAGFTYAGSGVTKMGGGLGTFEFVINGPHSGSGASLPLHFRVSRTDGFASDLDLFEANALGFYFGAHVRNNESGSSDFVGAQDLSPTSTPPSINAVPEPASLALLGSGLFIVARRLSRSRRKPA